MSDISATGDFASQEHTLKVLESIQEQNLLILKQQQTTQEHGLKMLEVLERMAANQSLAIVQETYTTEFAAGRLNRKPWTVRQWCNEGQAKAHKVHGKGRKGEWRITHEELVRLQNDGPKSVGSFDNEACGSLPFRQRKVA